MILELYALLTITGLGLFIASYIWEFNPFIPLLAGLIFLALAPNSVYVTKSASEWNATSELIVHTEYEITPEFDWMMYVWVGFFLVCLLETIVRSFALASHNINQEEPKFVKRH